MWGSISRSDLSGGSIKESEDLAGTATLVFSGTGVSWISYTAPFNGIAQVYIDGTLNATVDTYAPAEHAQAVVYAISGLPAGPQKPTIKGTGHRNAARCRAWSAG